MALGEPGAAALGKMQMVLKELGAAPPDSRSLFRCSVSHCKVSHEVEEAPGFWGQKHPCFSPGLHSRLSDSLEGTTSSERDGETCVPPTNSKVLTWAATACPRRAHAAGVAGGAALLGSAGCGWVFFFQLLS